MERIGSERMQFLYAQMTANRRGGAQGEEAAPVSACGPIRTTGTGAVSSGFAPREHYDQVTIHRDASDKTETSDAAFARALAKSVAAELRQEVLEKGQTDAAQTQQQIESLRRAVAEGRYQPDEEAIVRGLLGL